EMATEASPITYLTADDPPVYLLYGESARVDETSNPSVWVHHAIMGIKLKEQMDALGIECQLDAGRKHRPVGYVNATDFLIAKLTHVSE
ncbi:MAG: esterase, partial [Puniceicoccales bacterium]